LLILEIKMILERIHNFLLKNEYSQLILTLLKQIDIVVKRPIYRGENESNVGRHIELTLTRVILTETAKTDSTISKNVLGKLDTNFS
jgi:hypothetical protein